MALRANGAEARRSHVLNQAKPDPPLAKSFWQPLETLIGIGDGADFEVVVASHLNALELVMLVLPSPDMPEHHFTLREQTRELRRGQNAPAIENAGRISLTTPFAIPIDDDLVKEDAELSAFWKAQRDVARYDYVTFRCTFAPTANAPFDRVWVKIKLVPSSGQATAWSMNPKSVIDNKELTRTAKLTGEAKLFGAEVSGSEKAVRKEAFLLAQREHSSEPYWEFRASASTKIEGTFALHLVVRAEKNAQVNGAISAEASVWRRSFPLFSETSTVADVPGVAFTLNGSPQ
jgi:hypothetical protein